MNLSHCIGPGMRIRITRSVSVRTTPMRNSFCTNALCEGNRRWFKDYRKIWFLGVSRGRQQFHFYYLIFFSPFCSSFFFLAFLILHFFKKGLFCGLGAALFYWYCLPFRLAFAFAIPFLKTTSVFAVWALIFSVAKSGPIFCLLYSVCLFRLFTVCLFEFVSIHFNFISNDFFQFFNVNPKFFA